MSVAIVTATSSDALALNHAISPNTRDFLDLAG